MATPFHLELVTPERVLLSTESDGVSLRTDGGEIAFLAHHEDYIGAIDICLVTISLPTDAGHEGGAGSLRAAVHGGFVHVEDEGVRILASVAELADEIDIERARRALGIAESELAAEPTSSPEEGGSEEALSPTMVALLFPESPEAARRRASARLEAAGAGAARGDATVRATAS